MLLIGISVALFCVIQMFARPAPKTMTAQYQEMSNEYLKVRYANKQRTRHHAAYPKFTVLTTLFR